MLVCVYVWFCGVCLSRRPSVSKSFRVSSRDQSPMSTWVNNVGPEPAPLRHCRGMHHYVNELIINRCESFHYCVHWVNSYTCWGLAICLLLMFQVARLSILRSQAYQEWYQHLSTTGGIFFHRWGDAPIRFLGLQMLPNPVVALKVQGCSHESRK